MIEPLQREAVEIGEIAGDVELADLARAVAQILEAAEEAVEQHHAVAEQVAGADQGRIGGHLPDLADRGADRRLLVCGDFVARAQLAKMGFDHAGAALPGTNELAPCNAPPARRFAPRPPVLRQIALTWIKLPGEPRASYFVSPPTDRPPIERDAVRREPEPSDGLAPLAFGGLFVRLRAAKTVFGLCFLG